MAKYKFGRELQDVKMSGETDRRTDIRLINAIEKAVYYFMGNHLMDEMTKGCNISKQFFVRKTEFDFETDCACIEIKSFMTPSDKKNDYIQERFCQGIKRGIEHGNSSVALSGEKRKILLVIGHKGIYKEIRWLLNQEVIKSLRKAVGMGLELWAAEMEFELGNGIELLSYKNVANDIPELK